MSTVSQFFVRLLCQPLANQSLYFRILELFITLNKHTVDVHSVRTQASELAGWLASNSHPFWRSASVGR